MFSMNSSTNIDVKMEDLDVISVDAGLQNEISKLKDDEFLHILEFLPVPDKKKCSLVSKYWNEMTKMPRLAENMMWTFDVDYIFENLTKFCYTWYHSTSTLYHIQIKYKCTRSDVEPSHIQMFHSMLKNLGTNTKILTFAGSRSLVGNLLIFPNLRVLNIPKLIVLKDMKIPDTVQAIHVKILSYKIDADVLEILRGMPNLKKITGEVLICSCYSCNRDAEKLQKNVDFFEISDQLMKIMDHQVLYLKNVNVWKLDNPLELHQVELQPVLGIRPNEAFGFSEILKFGANNAISKLRFQAVYRPTSCWFRHEIIPFPNLKSITLNGRSYDSQLCTDCLDFFLKSCPKLNSIEMPSTVGNYGDTVFKAKIPFKEIFFEYYSWVSLHEFVNSNESLDHNMFKDLEYLHISLRGKLEEDFKNWPAMPRLKYLSINLDCLDFIEYIAAKCPGIRKFFLYSDTACLKLSQLNKCVTKFPYLKNLYISCTGYRFVPVDLLKLYKNFSHLRKFTVDGGFFYRVETGRLKRVELDYSFKSLFKKKLAIAIPTLRKIYFDDILY